MTENSKAIVEARIAKARTAMEHISPGSPLRERQERLLARLEAEQANDAAGKKGR